MEHHVSELVLVRHGQTVWHTDNRYAGRSEVDLTDLGRHQAKVLGGWAAGAGLSAVVASTMQRAIDTATPAAAAAGVELVTDPRLVELDFGRGEGMTRTEMPGVFPDAVAAFVRAPASHPYPGGELGADAVARAMPALTDLAAGEPDAHHRFAYWLDKRGRSSEAEHVSGRYRCRCPGPAVASPGRPPAHAVAISISTRWHLWEPGGSHSAGVCGIMRPMTVPRRLRARPDYGLDAPPIVYGYTGLGVVGPDGLQLESRQDPGARPAPRGPAPAR